MLRNRIWLRLMKLFILALGLFLSRQGIESDLNYAQSSTIEKQKGIEWQISLKEDWKRRDPFPYLLSEMTRFSLKDWKTKEISGRAMYLPGEIVTFLLDLKNHGFQTTELTLEWMINDVYGQMLGMKKEIFRLEPGTVVTKTLNYQPKNYGVFYAKFRDIEGFSVKRETITFSVIPLETSPWLNPDGSPFGICHGIPNAMPVVGCRWLRTDFIWDQIEPERDKFYWESTDNLLKEEEGIDTGLIGWEGLKL